MSYIPRSISLQLDKWIDSNKTIIIYGPRQVGKTSLLKKYIQDHPDKKIRYLNCDLQSTQDSLKVTSKNSLELITQGTDYLFIDEAQKITNIGNYLKIIHDSDWHGQIIATGSSSFDLANKISEPMTGRYIQLMMYPLSLYELQQHTSAYELHTQLEKMLLYGLYPDIYLADLQDKKVILDTLAGSYVYKDVLEYDRIKKSHTIVTLLQLLALQIGSQVSYHELGQQLGIKSQTVQTYIDLLEKAFIVYRLTSYSNNPRKELSKSKKIYFWDLGVRNMLINNFSPLQSRTDIGAIRENFVINERIKFSKYTQEGFQYGFRKSRIQQEVDLVETKNEELNAYEIKRNIKKNYKFPKTFLTLYPHAQTQIITPENVWSLVQ